MDEMHDIEHAQDQIKNELRKNLIKEFITPIDWEDILEWVHRLVNVTHIREDAREFIEIIEHSCFAMTEMKDEFAHFDKLDFIHESNRCKRQLSNSILLKSNVVVMDILKNN